MVQLIPPPDPHGLLPPLLACLPTAFASPRPPPALLPLLSPVLRQRVQLLSATTTSNSESWLPLLCWNREKASKLAGIIEAIELEPHPVSGEVELPEIETIQYRRLDQETLQSKLEMGDFGLMAIYLWCMSEPAEGGSAWKLAELRARENGRDGAEWFPSMIEADEGHRERDLQEAVGQASTLGINGSDRATAQKAPSSKPDDDDDDDYWASYDRTPCRTPAKQSPAPTTRTSVQPPTTNELEYFARYMSEVQPAMDPHDPSEEGLAPGESTLNGDELTHQRPQVKRAESSNIGSSGYDSSLPPAHANGFHQSNNQDLMPDRIVQDADVDHPRPRSSTSSSLTNSVGRLERRAETLTNAEVGIKQHISTDIKSLFRLSRSAGIEREEFERIVKTELEMLSMMDMDE